MEKIIKLILAIAFISCLLEMPYGYFQLVRLIGLIGFAILAYKANQEGKQTEMFVYLGLAILFQPFIKIALGRQIWNAIDVIVGLGLLLSIFFKPSSKSE